MKSMLTALVLLCVTVALLSGCDSIVPQSADLSEKISEPQDSIPDETIVYKGDPNYVYDSIPEFMESGDEKPVITYSLGEKTNLDEVTEEPGKDYIMLMIDGKLVPKAGVIYRDGHYLARLDIMSEWMGGSIRLDDKAETIDGVTYVSLDVVAKSLETTVVYIDKTSFPVDHSTSLWVDFPFPFPLITIDPLHEDAAAATAEEAIQIAKDLLMAGYENYSTSIKSEEWYADNLEVNDQILETIKSDIQSTFYLGEISRYFVLRGPYEMLVDKYTLDIYFYQPSINRYAINSYTYTDDPDLFTVYYFAG